MAVRDETLPSHPFRLFMAPAAVGAILMALIAAVRRRAARPSLPRMSDEWLRSHGSHSWDSWR